MPLVINSPGGGHTHIRTYTCTVHTHTYTHIHTCTLHTYRHREVNQTKFKKLQTSVTLKGTKCAGNGHTMWNKTTLTVLVQYLYNTWLTSPLVAALAPTKAWIFVTSAGGPAISEVPLSITPWHPPLQKVVLLTVILQQVQSCVKADSGVCC